MAQLIDCIQSTGQKCLEDKKEKGSESSEHAIHLLPLVVHIDVCESVFHCCG